MTDIAKEFHPLLNAYEMEDALFSHGHSRALGARIFNLIIREAGTITPDRTSASIIYNEVNQEGQRERVISLPNLAAHLPEVGEFPQLGTKMLAVITELVEPYHQS